MNCPNCKTKFDPSRTEIAAEFGRFHTGVKERPSQLKKLSNAENLKLARARLAIVRAKLAEQKESRGD
jgi:hypothetical protein